PRNEQRARSVTSQFTLRSCSVRRGAPGRPYRLCEVRKLPPLFTRLLILAVLAALPVALSRTWGLIPAALVAIGGAFWIGRDVRDRYIRPVERLGEMLRQTTIDASPEDLAQQLVSEYRDALTRMDETLAQNRRREAAL